MRDNRRKTVRNLALKRGVAPCESHLPRPNTIDSSKIRIPSSKIGSFLAATKCILPTKSETCSILHSTRLPMKMEAKVLLELFPAILCDPQLERLFRPNRRWREEHPWPIKWETFRPWLPTWVTNLETRMQQIRFRKIPAAATTTTDQQIQSIDRQVRPKMLVKIVEPPFLKAQNLNPKNEN